MLNMPYRWYISEFCRLKRPKLVLVRAKCVVRGEIAVFPVPTPAELGAMLHTNSIYGVA